MSAIEARIFVDFGATKAWSLNHGAQIHSKTLFASLDVLVRVVAALVKFPNNN